MDIEKLFNYAPEVAEKPILVEETSPPPATTPAPQPPSSVAESVALEPLIPFEVNRTTVHILEQLFDPALGATFSDAKLLTWFQRIFS